jgi:hypothetical protein
LFGQKDVCWFIGIKIIKEMAMSRRRRSQNSRNVITAVWLIGLGILWLTDLLWPGILVLIGVGMLVQAMLPREVAAPPPARREKPALDERVEAEVDEWEDDDAEIPAFMLDDSEKKAPNRNDLLPVECPACGGPVAENAHKVQWRAAETAICPFCETDISLKKT